MYLVLNIICFHSFIFVASFVGELKTLATLDREQKSVYSLMVKASDAGGRFCQSDIILNIEDINDNPPEFTAETYSITVFENTELNTLLTRVHATDADAGMSYRIIISKRKLYYLCNCLLIIFHKSSSV